MLTVINTRCISYALMHTPHKILDLSWGRDILGEEGIFCKILSTTYSLGFEDCVVPLLKWCCLANTSWLQVKGHCEGSSQTLEPEPVSLWEYLSFPLSHPQTVMTFDISFPIPCDTVMSSSGEWILASKDSQHPCHAVVMWMEYQLLEDRSELVVSEGLVQVRIALRIAFTLKFFDRQVQS